MLLKNLIQRHCYSKETYGLLNYVTLSIKDKKIQQEYSNNRKQRFDKLLCPFLIIILLKLASSFIQYQKDDIDIAFVYMDVVKLIVWLMIGVPRFCHRRVMPWTIFPAFGFTILVQVLIFYGHLPMMDLVSIR